MTQGQLLPLEKTL